MDSGGHMTHGNHQNEDISDALANKLKVLERRIKKMLDEGKIKEREAEG